jgi:serine/threonine protein kinase
LRRLAVQLRNFSKALRDPVNANQQKDKEKQKEEQPPANQIKKRLPAEGYRGGTQLDKGGQGKIFALGNKEGSDKALLRKEGNDLRWEALALETVGPHPNIVGFGGLIPGSQTDKEAIILEHIEGENLDDKAKSLLAEAKEGSAKAATYLKSVLGPIKGACAAASHLASLGLVHNDLNPRNLMIDKSGNTKVIDFGSAREPGKTVTKTAAAFGKMDYGAPELGEEGKGCSPKSDVYSLGMMLVQDCTLPLEMALKQADSAAFEHVQEILQRVKDLSVRCRKRNPEERPSATEVAGELEVILGELQNLT